MSVQWLHSQSEQFEVSNGVRQGGVWSPILFTIYIGDLLIDLQKTGVGCHWKHHFAEAVCYADDIALLAPSPSALCLMLDKCTSFAESHSLVFNAGKTQLIKFHRGTSSVDQVHFSFLGQRLQLNSSVRHLGHVLSSDLLDNEDIISIKKDLCRKANHILSTFACCDPPTKFLPILIWILFVDGICYTATYFGSCFQ